MADNSLVVNHIRKTYPGVVALDDVSFDLRPGEVHALVGENGAGKSTLIKSISGAIPFNEGSIIIDGVEYTHMDPILSRSLGIEVIYQEFNLMPSLTVAENICLTDEHKKGSLVDFAAFRKRTQAIFDEMNIHIDPNEYVKFLSNAQKQLVEIVTAALTVAEVDVLYDSIKRLKARGVSMIYISHRLEEVFEVSDRVTVLRDGKTIGTINTNEATTQQLITMMVGRELSTEFPKRITPVGDEVVLEAKGLLGKNVNHVSFQLKKGEILGFAGLVGAGRTEIVRCVFGADGRLEGDIYVDGKLTKIKTPADAVNAGMSLVSEDRKLEGVLLGMSIKSNIVVSLSKKLSKYTVVDSKKEREIAQEYSDKLRIKTPSIDVPAGSMSGGNQQKVAMAKSLAAGCHILILDEPTRGIDVGAKREIYNLMRELSEQGISIIMVSSEMDELLGMSDRVLVVREGEIVGELDRSEFNQEKILILASGAEV